MFNFGDIIGNTDIIRNLHNAISNDRISHAYLFEGGAGMGKTLMASAFAKTLQCEGSDVRFRTEACGTCPSCIQFNSMNHPDVIRIIPTKTKSLGVEDIRDQANRKISTKPYRYRYKIFIIDDADTMSTAAQNALLKTLEEPAPKSIFLLTVRNRGLLLPTILSRCQILKFRPLSPDDIKNYLVNKLSQSEEKARFLSVYAGGSIGQAVKASEDTSFMDRREKIIDILDGIDKKDLMEVFGYAKDLETFKDNMDDILNIAALWYRDIMILQRFGDDLLVFQKDILSRIKRNLHLKFGHICKNIDEICEARNYLRYNANFQLVTEVMLLRIMGFL